MNRCIFSNVDMSSNSNCSPASVSSSGSSTDDLIMASRQLQRRSKPETTFQRRLNLTDLQHFPSELSDPSRLLLVSGTNENKKALYACRDCKGCGSQYPQHAQTDSATYTLSSTVWALSFHHRYAFCTGCGESAESAMSAKQFAEIFVSATLAYLECLDNNNKKEPRSHYIHTNDGWWVGADSSCTLRVMGASGADACGCGSESPKFLHNGGDIDGDEVNSKKSVWAVSSVYSHAFCTSCSRSAQGPTLLSLLLAIRFGGKKLMRRRSQVALSTSGSS